MATTMEQRNGRKINAVVLSAVRTAEPATFDEVKRECRGIEPGTVNRILTALLAEGVVVRVGCYYRLPTGTEEQALQLCSQGQGKTTQELVDALGVSETVVHRWGLEGLLCPVLDHLGQATGLWRPGR